MLKHLFRQFLRPRAFVPDAELALVHIRELLRSDGDAAAAPALDRYLARHPQDPQALHLRGLLELKADKVDEAAATIAQALRYDQNDPVFRANLGLCLWRGGRLAEARAELEAVLDRIPGMASAALNASSVLVALGEPGSAYARLIQALSHTDEMSAQEAARLWVEVADLEPYLPAIDGRDCLRRARALDPDYPFISLLGYMTQAHQCDWSYPAADLVRFFERAAVGDLPADAPVLPPGVADCLPVSPAARLATARRCCLTIEKRVVPLRRDLPPPARRHGDKRIRIGYLSADFHNHPTMHLLRGVLATHDRDRFESYAYSIGPDDGSGVREEAMLLFEHFNDVMAESPLATARRIMGDGIDILVDLKGYTGGSRPEIAALRPAPVQVCYLGYPGTMAADFIDYLIADRTVIPPGDDTWYSEKIVTLPDCYQANNQWQEIALPRPSRADAGLPADAFVFCSFNSTYKIEPHIFSTWMEILRAAPHALLWIHADREEARANLRREAHARGIDAVRLIFAATVPKADHLSRIALADLFLDTHFVSGHTTASDSLWAGLPLITCPGNSFSSRVAASLLCTVGLADLVCGDLASYRELAVALAHDPARLRALRGRLAAGRLSSPLFDTRMYTRHLEAAYTTMHAIACAGDAPAAFCVRRVGAGAGESAC